MTASFFVPEKSCRHFTTADGRDIIIVRKLSIIAAKETDMPEKTVYRYINVLANRQRRRFENMELDLPFSSTQGKVLHFILDHGDEDVFQKDVEDEFGLRPSSATELLKSMEAGGLLSREACASDGRRKRIIVSAEAKRYKQMLDSELDRIESQITGGLDRKEIEIWKMITARMVTNLQDRK